MRYDDERPARPDFPPRAHRDRNSRDPRDLHDPRNERDQRRPRDVADQHDNRRDDRRRYNDGRRSSAPSSPSALPDLTRSPAPSEPGSRAPRRPYDAGEPYAAPHDEYGPGRDARSRSSGSDSPDKFRDGSRSSRSRQPYDRQEPYGAGSAYDAPHGSADRMGSEASWQRQRPPVRSQGRSASRDPYAERGAPSARPPRPPRDEWDARADVPGAPQVSFAATGAGAPHARKPARRRLLIVSALVAILVLVGVLAAGGWVVYASRLAAQPINTLDAFCSALQRHDDAGAYALLSPTAQHGISAQTFTSTAQLSDQVDGPITHCVVPTVDVSAGFSFNVNATRESFAVQIVRATPASAAPAATSAASTPAATATTSASAATPASTPAPQPRTYSGVVTLVKQGSAWQVQSLDAALLGTEVGPLIVTQQFCAALLAHDYTTAYQAFASTLQSQVAANALGPMFGATSATKLTGCQPTLSTYTVAADDTTAAVTLELSVQAAGASAVAPLPLSVALTFHQDAPHTWKITSVILTPQAPAPAA